MITHVASSHNLGIGMAAVNLARANGEQVSNLSHHVANGSQEGAGVGIIQEAHHADIQQADACA